MVSLQGPGRNNRTDPMGHVLDRIDDVQQQASEATSSLLRSAGIRARPARITSTNYDGTDRADLGTTGWSLGADEPGGETYFVLDGVDVYASLQSQIDAIEEAQDALAAQQSALAALVAGQVAFGIAPTATFSGWASTTGQDTKAASTIPVPAGYSQALVFALASMHFMDTSPNGGWVRATIAGEAGGEMGGLANLQLGQSASHTRALTGLTGSPIVIQCQMRSSVATVAMSGRIAQVSGFALFLR